MASNFFLALLYLLFVVFIGCCGRLVFLLYLISFINHALTFLFLLFSWLRVIPFSIPFIMEQWLERTYCGFIVVVFNLLVFSPVLWRLRIQDFYRCYVQYIVINLFIVLDRFDGRCLIRQRLKGFRIGYDAWRLQISCDKYFSEHFLFPCVCQESYFDALLFQSLYRLSYSGSQAVILNKIKYCST
jgi:hypothetical protein